MAGPIDTRNTGVRGSGDINDGVGAISDSPAEVVATQGPAATVPMAGGNVYSLTGKRMDIASTGSRPSAASRLFGTSPVSSISGTPSISKGLTLAREALMWAAVAGIEVSRPHAQETV